MKKLSDQELDSLFKDASEGYQPEFDQAAWDAMARKLDQPIGGLWKRWVPFVFLGVGIFVAGIWVGTMVTENSRTQPIPAQTNDKAISADQPTAVTGNRDEHEPQDMSRIAAEIKNEGKPAVEYSSTQKEAREALIERRENGVPGNVIVRTPGSRTSVTVEPTDVLDPRTPIVAYQELPPGKDKESNSGLNEATSPAILQAAEDALSQDDMVTVEEPSAASVGQNTEETAAEEKRGPSNFLFVRLLASPDLSSIHYSSTDRVGSNYALLLEYQLNNRWSVSSGGILSSKKYASDKNVSYGGYRADHLNGACKILDIPLNITYRFLPGHKISFYASAGFSSYIMMSEAYTYTVASKYGDRTYATEVEGKNNEWFKVANLSLGIQYSVTPKLSVQAEPFVKAPLTGVGEEDVLLSSMGLFIGLRYQVK